MKKYTLKKELEKENKNKIVKLIEEKGFYIVLILCIAAIGVTAMVKNFYDSSKITAAPASDSSSLNSIYLPSGMNSDTLTGYDYEINSSFDSDSKSTAKAPENSTKKETPTEAPKVSTDNNAVITASTQVKPDPIPEPSAAPATAPPKDLKFTSPLIGGVYKDYSADKLVYSMTFDDWRVHMGIDIESDLGAQVKAAEDGIIEEVYQDDMMGITVIIKHNESVKTLYANLQSLDFVKKGQSVSKGDVIGGVGNSAVSESVDPPHLHFEVIRENINVSPKNYLTF